MITYKTLSVAEAFQKASQDATWNDAERAALADIAKGLFDSNWNMLYMAGEVQKDGKDWDGTEEDLRPQKITRPHAGREMARGGSGSGPSISRGTGFLSRRHLQYQPSPSFASTAYRQR